MTISNLTYDENPVLRGPVGNQVTINQDIFTVATDAMWRIQQSSSNPYSNTVMIERTPTYTGGTKTWVNSALYLKTTIPNNTATSEWGITSVMNNNGQGENVAGYFQGNRVTTTAATTWGAVIAANDQTGTSSGAIVGLELDVFSNGTTSLKNRIGIDIVTGKFTQQGSAADTYAGIRVGMVWGDITQGNYHIGCTVGDPNLPAIPCGVGYIANTTGSVGFEDLGSKLVGFYAAGAYSQSAFRMSADQYFDFEATHAIKMKYNPSNGHIEIYNGGVVVRSIDMASGYKAL